MTGIEALRQLKAENENLKARLEGRTKHLNFYRQRLKFRRDQIAEISRQRDAEANRRFDLERELDALRDKISHMQEQGSTSHLKPKYDMALREIEDLKRQAHVRGTSQAYKAMKNRLEGTELEINSLKYQLERVNEVNDRGSRAFNDLTQYCKNIESANQEFVRRVDQKQEVIKAQSDTIMKQDARIVELEASKGNPHDIRMQAKLTRDIADKNDVIAYLEGKLRDLDRDTLLKNDRINRQSRRIADLLRQGPWRIGIDVGRPGGDKTAIWYGTRTGRYSPPCSIRESAYEDMRLEHERAIGLHNFMATVDYAKMEKQLLAYYSGIFYGHTHDFFKKPVEPNNLFAQFMNSLDK